MTSNTAIRLAGLTIAFTAAFLPLGSHVLAAGQTVFAVAKLNGRSKVIKGKRYDLVVQIYDWRPALSATNGSYAATLVNGKEPISLPADISQELKGKHLPLGLGVGWMMLPEKGSLEILYGTVNTGGGMITSDQIRAQLMTGQVPFTIDIKKISTVQAKTVDELLINMVPLMAKNLRLVPGLYKVNDRTKTIDKEKYHLVTIPYEEWLKPFLRKPIEPVWLVNGRRGEEVMRPVDLKADKKDLPKDYESRSLPLWWMKLPEKGQLDVTYAVVPNPAKKPAELVKQIKQLGYLPFQIDAAKIPTIRGQTVDELELAIANTALPKAPKK